jgi:hypothetical protein
MMIDLLMMRGWTFLMLIDLLDGERIVPDMGLHLAHDLTFETEPMEDVCFSSCALIARQ